MSNHSHYYKPLPEGIKTVDVYRVLQLFNVTDPCLQHAIKKLLVAGGRGAGKDINRDIQEAVDSLERWKAMRAEEAASQLVIVPERKRGLCTGCHYYNPAGICNHPDSDTVCFGTIYVRKEC